MALNIDGLHRLQTFVPYDDLEFVRSLANHRGVSEGQVLQDFITLVRAGFIEVISEDHPNTVVAETLSHYIGKIGARSRHETNENYVPDCTGDAVHLMCHGWTEP